MILKLNMAAKLFLLDLTLGRIRILISIDQPRSESRKDITSFLFSILAVGIFLFYGKGLFNYDANINFCYFDL